MGKGVLVLLAGVCLAASAEAVWYVNGDSSGPQDGKSWDTAFRTIQRAIDAAHGGDIWVAKGVYDEPRFSMLHSPPVNTGSLVLDGSLYGGFAGTETSRNQRNWRTRVTTIDGSRSRGGSRAYHVVVCPGFAILDGFTITGGLAQGAIDGDSGGPDAPDMPWTCGAGLYSESPYLVVKNCTFRNNEAHGRYTWSADWRKYVCELPMGRGGALYALNGAVMIQDCSFIYNKANDRGGAIYHAGGDLSLRDCVFTQNTAEGYLRDEYGFGESGRGGAVCALTATADFRACQFTRNTAGRRGGGLYAFEAEVTVGDCDFLLNQAHGDYEGDEGEAEPIGAGGGAYCSYGSVEVVRSVFDRNSTNYAGGGLALWLDLSAQGVGGPVVAGAVGDVPRGES